MRRRCSRHWSLAFGLIGYTGPVNPPLTIESRMRRPMLPERRDAPATATVVGASSGRIDAVVASAWRRSAAATDSTVGPSERRTVMVAFSDFDRSSNRVAEHIEHRVVLWQDPRFEAPESICPGHRRETFQQDRAVAFALKRIADR